MRIKIKNLNAQFSEEYLGAQFKPIYSLRDNSEKDVNFVIKLNLNASKKLMPINLSSTLLNSNVILLCIFNID